MQTASELCPDVSPTYDRNVFKVKSRSKNKSWTVDGEARHGLMSCDCPDFQMNKNYNCHHVQQARKFVSIVVMQTSQKQNQT